MSFGFRMSVVVGMLASLSLGTARAAEPANLIKEPSFEGVPGDNGLPSEWYGLHAMPDGKYRMALADTARTGKKSLLIAGDGQYGVVWGEKLKVDRKLRYRARGSVKIEGDEPAAADVKLHYYGANQAYLGQSRVGFVTSRTPGWQLITVTDQLDVFPEAEYLSIAVAIAGKGSAWFDDISLTAEPAAPRRLDFVANSGMEDIAADRPAGWHVSGNEGHKPICRFDTKEKQSGNRSLFLESTSEWAAAGAVQVPLTERLKLLGCELEGSVRVKQGTAHFSIAYFKDGQYIGHTRSEDTTRGEWHQVRMHVDAKDYPEATSFCAVVAVEGESAAWFDDVHLLPGGKK